MYAQCTVFVFLILQIRKQELRRFIICPKLLIPLPIIILKEQSQLLDGKNILIKVKRISQYN